VNIINLDVGVGAKASTNFVTEQLHDSVVLGQVVKITVKTMAVVSYPLTMTKLKVDKVSSLDMFSKWTLFFIIERHAIWPGGL
jgi:hypothetical protein